MKIFWKTKTVLHLVLYHKLIQPTKEAIQRMESKMDINDWVDNSFEHKSCYIIMYLMFSSLNQ